MMKRNVNYKMEWKDHWWSIAIFLIGVQFLCDDAWTLRIVFTYAIYRKSAFVNDQYSL